MTIMRNVGVVLVATGVVFLVVGFASIAAPVEKLMQALSGHYSSQTVLYIAACFAALAAGGLIVSTRTD